MNEKRATKKDVLLRLLLDGRPHHIRELNRISFRYGARFHELRAEGYDIRKRSVGEDEFEYWLVVSARQLSLIG